MTARVIFVFIFAFCAQFAVAQKFAYVDSEYILRQIPEYEHAQKQLDQLSEQWESEIASVREEVEDMRKGLEAERILLTDEMIEEKEEEIKKKEKEARDLQQKYFGPGGELFTKRKELIRPIQDQVYNAVQEVAQKKRLDIVFDKSSDLIMLYTDSRSDISEDVLIKLGYRN